MKIISKSGTLIIKISLCLSLLLNFSGCWNKREVEDLAIVVGIGIDRAETPGNILFTAQIVNPSQAGKTGTETAGGRTGENKGFWNVHTIKPTVFDAVRDVTTQTGKKLYVAHNQIIIFGSDIAKEGVQKYLDFFMRAHEIRPNNLVLVARGTAREVMEVKPEVGKLPAMNIAQMVEAYGLTSHLLKVNLQDFAVRLMMSKIKTPVAPLVGIKSLAGNRDIFVSGLAVFKKDQMVGILNQRETRGLLWVTGQVQSGIINVPTPGGKGKAALEIIRSKSKTTPEIRDAFIRMKVEINEEANLVEQSTSTNLATVTGLRALAEKQAKEIGREIRQSFAKSKTLNCDIFGFGGLAGRKYPGRRKLFQAKWDNLYPEIKLELKVKTRIRQTDLITRPVAPEEGV
ncbi:MAG TPA: Ger(x)C family spore germination protein [Bacillota bacterium]|nr:Ger(x)C family spore germination protein [Bacillota bacterium]